MGIHVVPAVSCFIFLCIWNCSYRNGSRNSKKSPEVTCSCLWEEPVRREERTMRSRYKEGSRDQDPKAARGALPEG